MALTDAPIIDLYAGLNHKAPMGPGPGPKFEPKTWVGKKNRRRLIAYQILDAYSKNNSKHYRAETEDRQDLREYGDADTIVEAVHSALIGDSQSFTVAHAEDFQSDFDPADKSERELEVQQRAEEAMDRQALIDEWLENERTIIKISGAEKKAVRLGDTVYALRWDTKRRRPKLRTYDPSFYFPVLNDLTDDDEFPTKVHLAWEVVEDEEKPNKKSVRRITYQLLPTVDENGEPRQINYPWNAEPTDLMCFVSDGVWEYDINKQTLEDLEDDKATWSLNGDGEEIRDMPLNIDFIPLIHVPNTEEDEEHFGASALLRIAQLLDDVAKADTDLVDTAANSAFPAIGFEGGEGPEADDDGEIKGGWGPGRFIHNPNGRIHVLSTSDALEPLSDLSERLLERLSVNARIPSSVLGRQQDANASESGLHLALSWGPLRSMIGQMRLSRQEKYALLMKFVQRFFQLDNQIESGPDNILPEEINFGAFLPTDRKAAIEEIATLRERKILSTRTAITMLVELGIPIDDAEEELRRIEQSDFEGAVELLQATGNEQAVTDYLGIEAEPTTPQTPEF